MKNQTPGLVAQVLYPTLGYLLPEYRIYTLTIPYLPKHYFVDEEDHHLWHFKPICVTS